jgi:hypothetical protein
LQAHPQNAQSIDGAAFEIYGGGFVKILGGTSDLGYIIPFKKDLGQQFIIENEIV